MIENFVIQQEINSRIVNLITYIIWAWIAFEIQTPP